MCFHKRGFLSFCGCARCTVKCVRALGARMHTCEGETKKMRCDRVCIQNRKRKTKPMHAFKSLNTQPGPLGRAPPRSHMQTRKWTHRKPCSDSMPQWFRFRMAKERSWLRVSIAAPTLPVQLCVCVQVCVFYVCLCCVCVCCCSYNHCTRSGALATKVDHSTISLFFLPVYLMCCALYLCSPRL